MKQKSIAEFLIWDVILAFILVLCSFFSQYKFSSYICIIAFGGFMLLVLKRKPGIFIKYMYLIFGAAAMFISLMVIEFGCFYVSETQLKGDYVGSIPFQALLYWLFFETLLFFDDRCEKKFKIGNFSAGIDILFKNSHAKVVKQTLTCITIVVVVLFVYMFLSVIEQPSFILGVDRGTYRMMFGTSFLYSKIYGWAKILLIPCILSIIYGRKFLGFIGVLIYILHSVWIGQKFGDFLTLLTVFLVIYYTKICLNKRVMKKIVSAALVGIMSLVLLSAFFFSFTSEDDTNTYFATRIAGQGAMWWRTYSLSKGEFHTSQLSNEIEGFLFGELNTSENVGADYGIYNIMYLCTSREKADYDIGELNTRYTEAGYASAYYIFGVPGAIIFGVICAILFAITINRFLYYLSENKYIEAFLLLRIYFLETTMYSMFTFNQYRSLFTFSSILFLVLIRNKKIVLKFA